MEKVRLGIVGMGNMGKAHRNHLLAGKLPEIQLTAICGREGKMPEATPGEEHFTDVSQMIASGSIDALLIATPHPSHCSIGTQAMEAGLHVLMEKPLAVHKADCERLIATHAQRPELTFGAMFQMRTMPLYRKIKDLIDTGELGTIRRILWDVSHWYRTEWYYATGGWRATWEGEGGGVLLNQCPHNLDLYQWLFGMPDAVHGFCQFGRYHQIEVEDDVTAHFQYKNGTTGVFISSTGEHPGNNRLDIIAENGLLRLENDQLTWKRNRQGMSTFSQDATSGFATPETWDVHIPTSNDMGSHVEVMQNFAQAILGQAELIAPAAEGMHSIELANAILLSSWKNSTIALPMDSAEYETLLTEKIQNSTFEKKKVDLSLAGEDDFSKSFR